MKQDDDNRDARESRGLWRPIGFVKEQVRGYVA